MTHSLSDLPPRKYLLQMRDRIERAPFTAGNWRELAIMTECSAITGHPRLLRSLSFGDPDYLESVLSVLDSIYTGAPMAIFEIEEYLNTKFPETMDGEYISSQKTTGRKIVFAPAVFQIPEGPVRNNLVSVMMPFNSAFDRVYETLSSSVNGMSLECQRASDIWENSTIIQDIFSLIFRSIAVICDFTGKNPNVFYEAGIAHTLGKHVIPITQNGGDIPFDLTHHRYLHYHNNNEGLALLGKGISERLWSLGIPF